MITLKKIASDLGLDRGTVSQILNHDDPRYNAETRRRVRAYADEIGYRPSAMARAMRTKKTGIVGFLFRQEPGHLLMEEYYYTRVIEGVQTELLAAGYKVLLSSVSNAEIASCQLPTIVTDRFVDGLIVLATSDPDWIARLFKACERTVIVDEAPLGYPAVVSANFEGGRQAAQYLWEKGHRSFGIITGERASANFDARILGFQSWIAGQLNAPVELPVYSGNAWEDGGAEAAEKILNESRLPSAIFCANDHLAIHAMKAFVRAGKSVPGDLSVMGYDNITVSEFAPTPLTTVAVDKRELGREAARMIIARLQGTVRNANIRKEMPVSIVERQSVASPHSQNP